MSLEEQSNFLINMNSVCLSNKNHIKKYYKLRNLHSEILDSMELYIRSNKYDSGKYFNIMMEELESEVGNVPVNLSETDKDDITVLTELFAYKQTKLVPSVTEIFLNKNKFKDANKKRLLESMKKSYVGFFRVIDSDRKNGYIVYEDVFTGKTFKVIDVSMSSTLKIDKEKQV